MLRDVRCLNAVRRSLNVNHPSLSGAVRPIIPRKDIADETRSPIDRLMLTPLIPTHKTITVSRLCHDLKALSHRHLTGAKERLKLHRRDDYYRPRALLLARNVNYREI